jgi:hypothetical protein
MMRVMERQPILMMSEQRMVDTAMMRASDDGESVMTDDVRPADGCYDNDEGR